MLIAFAVCTGTVCAQSLAELARQERERRAKLATRAPQVTNEDLQRARILPALAQQATQSPAQQPPAAQVRSESAAPSAPAPLPANVPLWKVAEQPGFSLGEYARQLKQRRGTGEAPVAVQAEAAPPAVPQAPAAAPFVTADVPLWKVAEQPGFSLGEYARQLRQKRVAERAEAPAVAETPAPAAPAVAQVPPASPDRKPLPRRSEPAEISLGEYARRVRQERTEQPARRAESEPAAVVSAAPVEAIVVRRGDSLWKLSAAHLGGGRLWTALWEANPEIQNPDRIYPGQLLRRPDDNLVARNRAGQREVAARRIAASRQLIASNISFSAKTQASVPAAPAPNPQAAPARLSLRPAQAGIGRKPAELASSVRPVPRP